VGLLDRILRRLGVNPVQLRWKLHQLRERSRRGARRLENRSRSLRYEHQICPDCGLTVDSKERSCPRCRHRLHGRRVQQLWRLWRLLVPEGTYTCTAVLTTGIVALYAAMVMVQPRGEADLLTTLGSGITHEVMDRFGAWTVQRVMRGEVWRLLTACFLHFGLLHLLFNGLWLVQLGPLVEQTFGRSRYVVLFLGSGVGGMALSVAYRFWRHGLAAPDIGAGASGVVFGFIGVALVRGYLKKTPGSDGFRGGIAKWALYALVFSLLPGIDLVAHLGGAATGAGLAAVLAESGVKLGGLASRAWLVVELACLVALAASFLRVSLGG